MIKFHDNFPENLRAELEEELFVLMYLVPEINQLQVCLKGAESGIDGEAAIVPLRMYHTAHLYIDPSFWALDIQDKRRTLIHELMHIKIDILSRETFRIAEEFVPTEFRSYIEARIRDAEETLVDSLAYAVDAAIYGRRLEDVP